MRRIWQAELDRLGILSKRREGAGGVLAGGNQFSRGALYLMLQNRLYRGDIVHQSEAYHGQHEPIIDPELCSTSSEFAAKNSISVGRRVGCYSGRFTKNVLARLFGRRTDWTSPA